jgi:non-homologous end joining protein Ku
MRKLIGFDDETLDKLVQLGRNRMATLQELADEAFADLLKKHGVPIDLRDALKKSVRSEQAGKGAGKASRKRTETTARKLSRS